MPLALGLQASAVARLTGADLRGEDRLLRVLASPEIPEPDSLVVLFRPQPAGNGLSESTAVLCRTTELPGHPCRLLHPNPQAALLQLLQSVCAPEPERWLTPEELPGRFPGVSFGPHTAVEASCHIGEGSFIDAGAVLHRRVTLGRNCHVGANTVLGADGFGLIASGDGFMNLPHPAGVILSDGVQIGPLSNIAAGLLDPTFIGEGCHLDAQVQIGHNCRLGKRCRLAAQVGVAGSVHLGDDCTVGGQAGFADHLRLGDRCLIAARAGVTRSWPEDSRLGGFPARPLPEWRRSVAASFLRRSSH